MEKRTRTRIRKSSSKASMGRDLFLRNRRSLDSVLIEPQIGEPQIGKPLIGKQRMKGACMEGVFFLLDHGLRSPQFRDGSR